MSWVPDKVHKYVTLCMYNCIYIVYVFVKYIYFFYSIKILLIHLLISKLVIANYNGNQFSYSIVTEHIFQVPSHELCYYNCYNIKYLSHCVLI